MLCAHGVQIRNTMRGIFTRDGFLQTNGSKLIVFQANDVFHDKLDIKGSLRLTTEVRDQTVI